MDFLLAFTGKIAGFLWGPPLLILLVGTGLYLTVGLRGIQFRKTFHAFGLLFKPASGNKEGDITPFQALTTALSATVGTGNIAGVATAIVSGGPGALFWMWIMGILGMATKFSEIFLSIKFRERGADGKMSGGPMYYIEHGLGSRKLAVFFAFSCLCASLGPGNLVQSNSLANALGEILPIPPFAIGVIAALLVSLVILGGIERIGTVTAKLVPLMAGIYFLGGMAIVVTHISELPSAISLIIGSALNPVAAVGGFAGATIKEAMQFGVARGTFSNEAGLGSAPIAHAAAKTDSPNQQALIGMIGVCIDTLVICSITGLAIVLTGVWTDGVTGAELTVKAFNVGLPGGDKGGLIVSIGLALFAFTTFIGWSYYGFECAEYLWGLKAANIYRYFFVIFIVVGPLLEVDLVWNIVDILVAVMIFPNVVALLGMSKMIFKSVNEDADTA